MSIFSVAEVKISHIMTNKHVWRFMLFRIERIKNKEKYKLKRNHAMEYLTQNPMQER